MHRLLSEELRKELLIKTGQQWACVISGSMSPMIQTGDRVLIEHVDPERLRLGDVIVFGSSGTWVGHRIIGKYRRSGQLVLLEKGDLSDGWGVVSAADVLGRVAVVQRGDRQFDLVGGWGQPVQLAMAVRSMLAWFLGRTLGRFLKAQPLRGFRQAASYIEGAMVTLASHLLASPSRQVCGQGPRTGGSHAASV